MQTLLVLVDRGPLITVDFYNWFSYLQEQSRWAQYHNAELITYTSKNATNFLGITRGTNGTATAGTSNGQAHSDGSVTVQNATD